MAAAERIVERAVAGDEAVAAGVEVDALRRDREDQEQRGRQERAERYGIRRRFWQGLLASLFPNFYSLIAGGSKPVFLLEWDSTP